MTFDEPVDVTGSPRLKIKMDPRWGEFWAAYEGGGGTGSLTFAYRVAEPNTAPSGIAVLANTLELNGGTIQAGGADAGLAHAGLAHDANHKVDWRTQPASTGEPTAVTGVEPSVSDAGADKRYGLGDAIRVRVTFGEAVDVTGSPRLKIKMDPRWGEFWAAYEGGGGTGSLTFAYRVAEPNTAPSGIAVLANTLELNGGTIRSGGADAGLAHAGLAHDANHKVDWRMQPGDHGVDTGVDSGNDGSPSVTGIAVASRPASGDTYLLGETIRVRVTFSEAVTVTGNPGLSIDMDPAYWGLKRADYESGSGTASLTFAYSVVWPNESLRGIAVLGNTLGLNGGTVKSAATQADARLGHGGLGYDPKHKVDWRPALSVADAQANEGRGGAGRVPGESQPRLHHGRRTR